MKDKLLLLFWGIVCGGVFVGAIFCFGGLINWLGAHQFPLLSPIVKAGLGIVIMCAILLIGKVSAKVLATQHIKQAAKVLPPECIAAALQRRVGKAVIEQREDQLEYFLAEFGDSPIYNGMTALHIAAALGYTDFCKILLKYGASSSAQDNAGRTPADWARAHGHNETASFLDKTIGNPIKKVVE